MLAANGRGGHFFHRVSVIDPGVYPRAVGRACDRARATDIGRAGIAIALRVRTLIKAEDEIVAQFIVMILGVDGAGEQAVIVIEDVVCT